MRRIFLGVALTTLVAGTTAMAADMPAKGPAVAPAPIAFNDWSGFYVGIHGGYGWKSDDFHEFLGTIGGTQFFAGGIDSKGWVVGGHVGYNWQRGWFVGGLELDMSATGIDGTSTPVILNFGGGVTQTVTREDDVKWLGSARARLGWAPQTAWPFWLYATGGLAWERFDRTNNTFTVAPGVTQTVTTKSPNDRFGWVIGAGAEAKLWASNWLIRLEYLHYEFGSSDTVTTVVSSVPGGNFAESNGNQTIDVVRGGLSYKF